jgi:hypothetical protein
MVSLSENDSNPRVKDATERHMRLCNQNPKAEKYKLLIQPCYNDFEVKRIKLEEAQKDVNSAQDIVWLYVGALDILLRNLNGRAKEYDRNNLGSNTLGMLFPGGNITNVTSLSKKEIPDAAHAVAQKVIALGHTHELYPFAAKIEEAVTNCRSALAQQVKAIQNMGDAKTALNISKIAVVRQYNANFFIAAGDVNKEFAEKLFPQLRPAKKKNNGNGNNGGEENNNPE